MKTTMFLLQLSLKLQLISIITKFDYTNFDYN